MSFVLPWLNPAKAPTVPAPSVKKGLRNSLVVPKWLANRPGLQVGYKYLFSAAVILDAFIDFAIQGITAGFPGLGTPTALPLIGETRGLIRGEAETDAGYAVRLRAWIQTHVDKGASYILAGLIQAYLGNTPTVRIVNRAGFWVSVDPSGTVTTATAAWDWDSVSNPERLLWWSDLWIIIYPTEWAVAGTIGATAAPSHDVEALGHLVPPAAVDAILGLVHDWKGAHSWVQAIIWSYDDTLFDPATPAAPGNPDGTWGNFSINVGGVQVPARGASSRYWIPSGGG